MRQVRRIGVILEALKTPEAKLKLLKYWFPLSHKEKLARGEDYTSPALVEVIKNWINLEGEIQEFWVDNPDLRLPQVLINKSVMPNYPGFYYHIEDEESMLKSGLLKDTQILFWGNNYDKDNNYFPETRWINVDEMSKGHLEAIVDLYDSGKMKVSEVYITMFKRELKLRE